MSDTRCACPGCKCEVEANAPSRDGQAYCCAACAAGHPEGMRHCRVPYCDCGSSAATARDAQSATEQP